MTETARAGLSARSPRPPVVMPTNKVTVALPFSKITVEEPRQELTELAAVVAELAALVEAAAPGPGGGAVAVARSGSRRPCPVILLGNVTVTVAASPHGDANSWL